MTDFEAKLDDIQSQFYKRSMKLSEYLRYRIITPEMFEVGMEAESAVAKKAILDLIDNDVIGDDRDWRYVATSEGAARAIGENRLRARQRKVIGRDRLPIPT